MELQELVEQAQRLNSYVVAIVKVEIQMSFLCCR